MAQEEAPQKSELPIAGGTTNSDQERAEERPNKYKYPEFDGLAGERYLLSIAEQIAPLALWRTWYAAVGFQAPGQACYVGVGRIVERVGPRERKIYLDLQALEARGWLQQVRARMPFLTKENTITHHAVTIKDFTGFYDTAHDYHLWIHSPDYIAPERENAPLILADAELTRRLIKFECYRRILICGKPGRKRKEEATDYYSRQLAQVEQIRASVQEVNVYFNGNANTIAPYRIDETGNNLTGDSSSFSTSEKGTVVAAQAIRRTPTEEQTEAEEERGTPTEQPYSKPEPKPTPTVNTRGGGAAKRVVDSLGYTEEELRRDPKKRGAAAIGIPADQHEKLHGGLDRTEQAERRQRELEAQAEARQSRPERERPAQVEKEVEEYARQYDDPELIQGDITRAVKIFFAAQQALDSFNDSLFWAFYDEARKAAAKYAHEKRNRKNRVNRVPYMFTCLENAFGFSLEELVFLRTEEPLHADYTLWDAIDYLRGHYQQQLNEGQTRLDYRAWLQNVLDQLEHRKEPKERNNRTTRDY
jgi:hypothetical protein